MYFFYVANLIPKLKSGMKNDTFFMYTLVQSTPTLVLCVICFFLVSLCRASQVSRTWHHMASDYRLWMNLCRYLYNNKEKECT